MIDVAAATRRCPLDREMHSEPVRTAILILPHARNFCLAAARPASLACPGCGVHGRPLAGEGVEESLF
jgi:hypothetical protein